MICEALNKNVLLVELSEKEMARYNISSDVFSDIEKSKDAVIKLLRIVRHNKLLNQRVTVDAMPMKNGGCFFIFTFKNCDIRKYNVRKSQNSVLVLSSIDDLLDLILSRKIRIEDKIICSLYKTDTDYYLVFPSAVSEISPTVTEFGHLQKECMSCKITEYGKFLGKITI